MGWRGSFRDGHPRGILQSVAQSDGDHREQSRIGERTGCLISELKGAGIISPKVAALREVVRSKGPIYELNPSLYPWWQADVGKAGTDDRLREMPS